MQTEYLTDCPALRLDHLERLTDDTGIVQHAAYAVPDRHRGYSIDDQARALIAVLEYARLAGWDHPPKAAYVYAAYLRHAITTAGWFHNFLSYSRSWVDDRGSDDCYGRAMWALGYAQRFGKEQGLAGAAAQLFTAQAGRLESLQYPRSQAFALFGLYHRLQCGGNSRLLAVTRVLADRLAALFETTATPDWPWFEDALTYCNAKLPAALLLAYELTGDTRYLSIGTTALRWLRSVVFTGDGELRLVGQDGWYRRGGVKAAFDEQCVDAQGMVEAAVIAERVTGEGSWRSDALAALAWFLGRNVHGVSLIDPATWGCYDGITAAGVNRQHGRRVHRLLRAGVSSPGRNRRPEARRLHAATAAPLRLNSEGRYGRT